MFLMSRNYRYGLMLLLYIYPDDGLLNCFSTRNEWWLELFIILVTSPAGDHYGVFHFCVASGRGAPAMIADSGIGEVGRVTTW